MHDSLLKNNVLIEKDIIKKLLALDKKDDNSKKLSKSLISELKIINDSIPKLIESVDFYKKIKENKESKNNKDLIGVKYSDSGKNTKNIALNKKDENKFISAIQKEKDSLKSLSDKNEFDFSSSYTRMAGSLFRATAINLSKSSLFLDTKSDLKKIGSTMVVESYISIALFSIMLSAIFAVVLSLIMFFVIGFMALILILLIPLIVAASFYLYPSSSVKSYAKKIDRELPFVTIYLSAISTSGIEPSKIFSIILSSPDYPATSREIKKLSNYINLYGADLVSALRYVSKNNPSEKLGLLFDGLATTITSGGEITLFLKKHSETLLFDYRLEREKYTQLAETFMNIYISVVIAAPLMLMVLLVLMSRTGFASGSLNSFTLSFISILVISLLNMGFLLFLSMKQPKF